MAFRTEPHKIVPGGLNVLAPRDQVADGDSLELLNFRPDAAGKLVQSLTSLVLATEAPGTLLNAVMTVQQRRYYAGTAAGSTYWSRQNGDASITALATLPGLTDPVAMASFQGWAWLMTTTVAKKDNGTNTYDWSTPAGVCDGAAAAAGGSLDAGDYKYYLTYTTDASHEGNPSAEQLVTVAANNKVTITRHNPPVGQGITGWNVYCSGPGLAVPYKLNGNAIAIATTTYVDYGDSAHGQDRETVRDNNEALEDDHDAAPAARVAADRDYNGRILVANSAAFPNRVWYTPPLRPWYFRGAANPIDGDWIDVGGDRTNQVLFISVRAHMVLFYTSKGIWRQVGDFDDENGYLDQVSPDVGIVGVRAACATSKADYLIAKDGVHSCNGEWTKKLSAKLDPLFRTESVDAPTGAGAGIPGIDDTQRATAAIGVRHGRVFLGYRSNGATTNDVGLVYHPDSDRWARGDAFNAYFDEGQAADFIGVSGNTLRVVEEGYKTGAALAWQSRFEDQGHPDTLKVYADLAIRHNTQGQDLTVKVLLNSEGTEVIPVKTINSSALTRQNIPLLYASGPKTGQPIPNAYNAAVRIDGTTSADKTAPIEIDSPLLLHWYAQQRKGKTFDSSETDHGTPDVKTLDLLELDIDNSDDTALLQILTSIPGGVMAARLGGGITIAKTTGRQPVFVPIDFIDGRLFRYLLTSNATGANQGFLLYGMRARLYRVGVYLDGSNAEKWVTLPIAAGV